MQFYFVFLLHVEQFQSTNTHLQIDERVIIDRKAEGNVGGDDLDGVITDSVASSVAEYLATKEATEVVDPQMDGPTSLHDLVTSDLMTTMLTDQQDKKKMWMLDPEKYSQPVNKELTDDDYFICRDDIVAFALDQKAWLYQVKISMLREIEWSADPYQSLQLSVDRKRLVHKLVKGFNTSDVDVYDDIIKGKGKGLIFLLHGSPGLGKTLTAGTSKILSRLYIIQIVNANTPFVRECCRERSKTAIPRYNRRAEHQCRRSRETTHGYFPTRSTMESRRITGRGRRPNEQEIRQ
jgi:hypothetical protein